MNSSISTLQALCACEITYHIRNYKSSAETKVSETEMLKTLTEQKVTILKEALWNGAYESRCFMDDAASCWICKTPSNEIMIAFRGTVPFVVDLSTKRSIRRSFEAIKDGLRNIFIRFEEGETIDQIYGKGSQVHRGFHQEAKDMWPFVLQSLKELDPEANCPITITGHSQGGGIAFLTALRFCVGAQNAEDLYQQSLGGRLQQVITFGAPQAGSEGFAQNYRKQYTFENKETPRGICLNDITYRYENAGDCIPIVPYKAADLAALFRHKYNYLPISMYFVESMVENMKTLLEGYVPVGQFRYIGYRDRQVDPDRPYTLQLADLYLVWAEKGKKGDIFSVHFLFKDDGYMRMYWDL